MLAVGCQKEETKPDFSESTEIENQEPPEELNGIEKIEKDTEYSETKQDELLNEKFNEINEETENKIDESIGNESDKSSDNKSDDKNK